MLPPPATGESQLRAVVMVARHGPRGPYGLRLDNPTEAELRTFAPNRSFAVDRASWRITEWQGLTEPGAKALRALARGEWRRYRSSLFGGRAAPLCEALEATPDTDARNLQSSAHFMSVLVGGGMTALLDDGDLNAASQFGAPIGGCNLTRPAPPGVLRQGGPPLPGLPPSCGTASEAALRALSKDNRPQTLARRHAPQLRAMGALLGCCAPAACAPPARKATTGGRRLASRPAGARRSGRSSRAASARVLLDGGARGCRLEGLPVAWSPRWWETWDGPLAVSVYFAELFLLQALTGLEVAWGELRPEQVVPRFGELLTMHNELSWNTHNARAHGSALAAHVLRLLSAGQQLAAPRRSWREWRGAPPPLPPRLTYLSAHDVNLMYLKQLLRLSWKAPGWPANYPAPGGALVFELLLSASGAAHVRVAYDAPPVPWERVKETSRQWLAVPACAEQQTEEGCPLERFQAVLAYAADAKCVRQPELQHAIMAHAPSGAGLALFEGGAPPRKDKSMPRRRDERGAPPWLLLLAVQTLGCVSDTLLGGAARRSSARRSLLIRTALSAGQCLLFLGALQLLAPDLTAGQYVGAVRRYCTDRAACPPQGPFSMLGALLAHPLLWANGLLALVYHLAEIALLRHPWGVLLKPIASLGATFAIEPLAAALGMSDASPPLLSVLIGMLGVLTSATEPATLDALRRKLACLGAAIGGTSPPHASPLLPAGDGPGEADAGVSAPKGGGAASSPSAARAAASRVLPPTVAIACCTALWNVSQRFFNDRYRINVWGYVSLDQVLAPLYVAPFLAATDAIGPLRALLLSTDDQQQSFDGACRGAWEEQVQRGRVTCEFWKVGVGVALSNLRVFFYFHLLITYNMSQTFFMLTLLRVVCSWLFVVSLAQLAPEIIDLTSEQRTRMFSPPVVGLKLAGSALILLALLSMVL